MPQASPFTIDIPQTDILSYLFPPGREPSAKPIWIDADEPQKHLSPAQLLRWVKRLGVGLQRLGLKDGDVLLTFSTNHIYVPVAYLAASASGGIFSGCNPAYGVSGRTTITDSVRCVLADCMQRLCTRSRTQTRRCFWLIRHSWM